MTKHSGGCLSVSLTRKDAVYISASANVATESIGVSIKDLSNRLVAIILDIEDRLNAHCSDKLVYHLTARCGIVCPNSSGLLRFRHKEGAFILKSGGNFYVLADGLH